MIASRARRLGIVRRSRLEPDKDDVLDVLMEVIQEFDNDEARRALLTVAGVTRLSLVYRYDYLAVIAYCRGLLEGR